MLLVFAGLVVFIGFDELALLRRHARKHIIGAVTTKRSQQTQTLAPRASPSPRLHHRKGGETSLSSAFQGRTEAEADAEAEEDAVDEETAAAAAAAAADASRAGDGGADGRHNG